MNKCSRSITRIECLSKTIQVKGSAKIIGRVSFEIYIGPVWRMSQEWQYFKVAFEL